MQQALSSQGGGLGLRLPPHATTLLTSTLLPDHPYPDLVYDEIKKKTKDGILRLVEKEREGELIARTLVKNILGIFIEVSKGSKGDWAASRWRLGATSSMSCHLDLHPTFGAGRHGRHGVLRARL